MTHLAQSARMPWTVRKTTASMSLSRTLSLTVPLNVRRVQDPGTRRSSRGQHETRNSASAVLANGPNKILKLRRIASKHGVPARAREQTDQGQKAGQNDRERASVCRLVVGPDGVNCSSLVFVTFLPPTCPLPLCIRFRRFSVDGSCSLYACCIHKAIVNQ